MKEAARREHRDRNKVHAARSGDQIGRQRHLRDFKLVKLELAPESFRRIGIGRQKFDAFRLNTAIHQRLHAFVVGGNEAESESWHRNLPFLFRVQKFNVQGRSEPRSER